MVTIGCPEVPLEFSVLCFQKGVRRTQVAAWGHGCGSFGGRIRIFICRCPEVGLEVSFSGVRGRIGIFSFRCPEVGLAVSLFGCPEVGLEFSFVSVQRSD